MAEWPGGKTRYADMTSGLAIIPILSNQISAISVALTSNTPSVRPATDSRLEQPIHSNTFKELCCSKHTSSCSTMLQETYPLGSVSRAHLGAHAFWAVASGFGAGELL